MHKFIIKIITYFSQESCEKSTTTNNKSSQVQQWNGSSEIQAVAVTQNKIEMISTSIILRRILPLTLFSLVFASVMTTLVIYMNTTAMKHQQFRVNMSQDIELYSISQDNPQFITYLREVHLKPAIEPHHNPIEFDETEPPEDTAYVLKLLNNKKEGVFVEAGAYNDGKTSKTEWLEKKLGWRGLLIQSDARHYFTLKRHNRVQSQAVHACLSTMPYPKEVTFHHQELEVNVNSVADDPDWFTTRIKCFPVFSLLLAVNTTNIDYFSLESRGTELQILETIPFERVRIQVIGVHLLMSDLQKVTIKKFLANNKYDFVQNFNNTYIFTLHP